MGEIYGISFGIQEKINFLLFLKITLQLDKYNWRIMNRGGNLVLANIMFEKIVIRVKGTLEIMFKIKAEKIFIM